LWLYFIPKMDIQFSACWQSLHAGQSQNSLFHHQHCTTSMEVDCSCPQAPLHNPQNQNCSISLLLERLRQVERENQGLERKNQGLETENRVLKRKLSEVTFYGDFSRLSIESSPTNLFDERAEAGEPTTNPAYAHPIFFFFLTSIYVIFFFSKEKNTEVKKKPSPRAPFKFITQRIGKWYNLHPPPKNSQSIETQTKMWIDSVLSVE